MQIHELNNFTGTLGAGAYLAVDDGNDTGKLSTQQLLAATEARIDNIIAGPAPSAEEIVDARRGADGVTYNSLGTSIRSQVTDLKSDITHTGNNVIGLDNKLIRVEYSQNRFNKDTIVDGGFLNAKGVVVEASGFFYSDLIPVEYGETYAYYLQKSQFGYTTGCNGYDALGNWVEYISADSSSDYTTVVTITNPAVKYVKINGKGTNLSAKQFVLGSSLPVYSAYSAPKYYINNGLNTNEEIDSDIDEAVSDSKAFIIGDAHNPINWFNYATVTDGAFILPSSGAVSTASGYFYSDLIPIEYGEEYIFDIQASQFGANGKLVAVYDKNGQYIGFIEGTNPTTTTCLFTNNNQNAKYCRINGRSWQLQAVQFVKDSVLPSYSDYFAPYYNLQEYIRVPQSEANNPLYGKKLAVTGDSICYGAGAVGGYGAIIAEDNGMTLQNIGVNGGTITSGTTSSSGNRFWICESIDDLDADADYILVEGGVNDASLFVSMGTITAADNFTGPFDTTTFCGAFESMVNELIHRFNGKKYGYIAAHACSWNYMAYRDNENSYYWAAKRICQKWGVPFCDLNVQVPPFALLPSNDAVRTAYTDNGDGWHPNTSGYEKYYVPKIVDWMKSL